MAQNTFAERLKEALVAKNYKQADLIRIAAERGIKLGKSQVSQYVSGKTLPRHDVASSLAQILDVQEAWLLGNSIPASAEGEHADSSDAASGKSPSP